MKLRYEKIIKKAMKNEELGYSKTMKDLIQGTKAIKPEELVSNACELTQG